MISSVKKRQFLLNNIWNNKTNYYTEANKASGNIHQHKGFQIINSYLSNLNNILDVGCGEGTKLSQLGKQEAKKTGVDLSEDAVRLARHKYPGIKFRKADIEFLPFSSDSFDAVFSAFVMEHLIHPKKVLKEMIRVTRKAGLVIIICPNFGAPNRSSPCYKDSKIVKLITGFIKQVFKIDIDISLWKEVEPLSTTQKHISDWDCLIEPEIISLISYFKKNNMIIEKWTSLWEEEIAKANKIQKIFLLFSKLRLYPFIYWGPQVLVIARKR